METVTVAGIDLGGTHARMALAGPDGRIVSTVSTSTVKLRTPSQLVDWAVRHAVPRTGHARIGSIGIGAPGPIDADRRVLLEPPNLPGWRDVPLAEMLEQSFGCGVHLENDANLAALAEFNQGAGRGHRNLVYITWSSGVGGGLILDGRLYTGSRGLAGEIGHIVAEPDGPSCNCGQLGCLEAICGGMGMARRSGRQAFELFRAADQGDDGARRIVHVAARRMGQALVTLTNIFDPDVIVIGGGIANAWDQLQPTLSATIAASPFIRPANRPGLRLGELGDQAGQVGAVEWARLHL